MDGGAVARSVDGGVVSGWRFSCARWGSIGEFGRGEDRLENLAGPCKVYTGKAPLANHARSPALGQAPLANRTFSPALGQAPLANIYFRWRVIACLAPPSTPARM